MLKVEEITNKKDWEQFLLQSTLIYPFFQSWNWGMVQEEMGHTIWRKGIYKDKTLLGVCQIIDVKARRGHYLHLRHGPVLKEYTKEYAAAFLDSIKILAKTMPWDAFSSTEKNPGVIPTR